MKLIQYLILATLFILIATSCGPAVTYTKTLQIDPELMVYFNHFVEIAKQEKPDLVVDNLIMTISLLSGGGLNEAGECIPGGTHYTGIVHIVPWSVIPGVISEQQKMLTVFHEMGHCVLKLEHNDTMKNGCPISYMDTYMMTDKCINQVGVDVLDREIFHE